MARDPATQALPRGGADPAMGTSRRTLLTVFVLALALRALPAGHGLPGLYVPDSHGVRNALSMAQTRNLVPRANEFSSYPNLFPYLCLPLFVGDFALARVTGRAASVAEYQQDASRHLERFHYLARFVAALGGALAAAAVAFAAGALAGRRCGAWAGVLAALSPMPLLIATHERPLSWVLACGAVSFGAALASFRDPASRRALALSALAAGAAGGFHQTGMAALAIPVAAAWLRHALLLALAPLLRRLADLALAAVLFAAGFLAGNPSLLRYGPGGGVQSDLTAAGDVSVGGQSLVFRFDAAHTAEALLGLLSLETVVPFLAVAGALALARRRDRRLLVALALAVPIFVYFTLYTGTHARYFLVAWPVVLPLAGVALGALAGRGRFGLAAALAMLAVPAALAARLDHLLLREDARGIAIRTIAEHVPAGDVVAIESYGPALPASIASLERLAAAYPEGMTRREQLALGQREPGGYDALALEALAVEPTAGGYTSLTDRARALYPGADDLPSLFARAGVRWVVRVDRFPSARRADPLTKILDARGELVAEVRPWTGDVSAAPPPEALLPFEPRLGALALWTVDRPGPWIRLYRLER